MMLSIRNLRRLSVVTIVVMFMSMWIMYVRESFHSIDQELINEYENDLLSHLYGNRTVSEWVNFSIPEDPQEQSVHIVQTRQFSDLPDVVLIHGYGATSALSWRTTMTALADRGFDVMAVDLPGFGRSPASQKLLEASTEEAFSLYCSYFETLFAQKGLESPYVVAHSIGAFIYVRCAARNPTLSSRLLLANVPGLFSSNGDYDFLWASFFTLGLPHNVLRLAGSPDNSRYLMDTALRLAGVSSIHPVILQYWHLVQLNNRMQSDRIVRKIIRHRGLYALGIGVGLPHLLNLSIPVALVYGEHDSIVPPHQGRYISTLTGIPIYIIKDSAHNPYSVNEGRDFVNLIQHAHEGETGAISPHFSKEPHRNYIVAEESKSKSKLKTQVNSNLTSRPDLHPDSNISNPNPDADSLYISHNKLLAACLHEEIHNWAWYPCLPLPPLLSNLLYDFGIYRAIDGIHGRCGI